MNCGASAHVRSCYSAMSLARTLQFSYAMAHGATIKLLLVSPWILEITGLRAALRDHGARAEIIRVDFEAALRTALEHQRFDLGAYVATPGLSFAAVCSCVRQHAPRLVMLEAADLQCAGDEIVRTLRGRWS